MMICSVLIIFGLYWIQNTGAFYIQLFDFKTTASLATIVFNVLSLVVLFQVCTPFDKFRVKVMVVISAMVAALMIYSCVMTYQGHYTGSILNIDYTSLTPLTYIIGLVVIICCAALFLSGYKIKDHIKAYLAEKKEAEKSEPKQ